MVNGHTINSTERFVGCLLGSAVGDSLLLPAEGLSRGRVARRFPGPLRHQLVGGRGMVSDDTEHAFLTAQALLAAGDDASAFAYALARRLRWWLITVPGGCGKATAQGLLRSWIGIHPSRCGVRSAGNGPAMRAAIIGLRWADDPQRMVAFVNASTALTHRDERARIAALAVATAAAHVVYGGSNHDLLSRWRAMVDDEPWHRIVQQLEDGLATARSVDDMAAAFGCPTYVSGYASTSVPLALYAWLRHPDDAEACLSAILRCGGDTDTMGAIAGAVIGAARGRGAFPTAWLERLVDWPLSVGRLAAAGTALGTRSGGPVSWYWPLQPIRNIAFILVILGHGFRRLLP